MISAGERRDEPAPTRRRFSRVGISKGYDVHTPAMTWKLVGKGWFCVLRLYSPTEPWFDKTWRPGEIELIQ